AALKRKTLQEGAIELLRELEQKVPIEIDWQIEDFSLDKGVEDHLFRILQESISNTLRHAKATTFHCMLIERDDMIILRVVDNGVGFDVEKVKANSYGRSEEHTSELQSRFDLVCRLLLEKKKHKR